MLTLVVRIGECLDVDPSREAASQTQQLLAGNDRQRQRLWEGARCKRSKGRGRREERGGREGCVRTRVEGSRGRGRDGPNRHGRRIARQVIAAARLVIGRRVVLLVALDACRAMAGQRRQRPCAQQHQRSRSAATNRRGERAATHTCMRRRKQQRMQQRQQRKTRGDTCNSSRRLGAPSALDRC